MKPARTAVKRRDEEEVFRILGEGAPVGLCIMQDGKFCYVNHNFSMATGYTAEELEGKDSLEIIFPEDRETVRENTLKMLKKELTKPYQFRVIRKDGSIIWVMATVRSVQYQGKRAILGNYMEITERKQMEDALKESEERYKELANSITDVFFAMDKDLKYTYWNKASEILTGIRAEDAIGKSINEVFPDSPGLRRAIKTYRNVLKTQQPQTFVNDFDIGGRHYTFEINAYPTRSGISVLAKDITQRKEAEEALQNERNKLQSLVSAIEYGLVMVDTEYNIIYQNEPSKKRFGEHLGEKCYQIFEGRKKICDGCPVEKAFKDGKTHTVERRTVMPSGEIIYWENTVSPIRDAAGRIVSCLEIARNVTDRKRVEEALRQSEENYKTLFDSAAVGLYVLDVETMTAVKSNRAAREMAGFGSAEEGVGVNPLDFVFPEDRAEVLEVAVKEFEQDSRRTHELRVRGRDGQPGWISISSARIMYKGKPAALVSFNVITERKKAEAALRQSEERYRALFESAVIGTLVLDRETMRVIMANRAAATTFGFASPAEAIGVNPLDFVPLEDRDSIRNIIEKSLFERDLRRPYDIRAVTKDGRQIWIYATGARIMYDGKVAALISFVDITEQKIAEQKLRDSEEKYRTILEQMEDSYFETDLAGNLTFVNDVLCRSLGYSREELIGMNYSNFTAQEDVGTVFKVFNEVYRTGVPNKGFSWKTIRKDGVRVFTETSVSLLRNEKGEIIGFRGVGRDVTERKRAEEALRQSEEKYRALFDSSVIGTLVIDAQTMRVVMANQAAAKIFGFGSPEEALALGINLLDYVPPEDRERVRETINREVFEQDLRTTHEIQALTTAGKTIWLSATGARIIHEDRLAGLICFTDITERKEAEDKLRRSEERYRTILEQMEDAYFEVDLGGHLTFVNDSVCRDLGYTREELIGMSYKRFTAPEDIENVFRVFNEVYRTGMPNKGFSWKTIRKDGVQGFAETSVSLVRNEKGEIIGFRGVGRDVTERRQAEEKLRQSRERYRALFESSIVGAVVVDAETMEILMANQAALKMFGFTSPEAGINLFSFSPPEDIQKNFELLVKEVFEKNTRESTDLQALTRDGRKLWVNVTGARITFKGRPAALLSFTDITKRKQVEEALRTSEEKYRTLFDNMVTGTVVLDAETMKVLMANQAALRMFGFNSAEESLKVNPLDFLSPDKKERVLQIAKQTLMEGSSREAHDVRALTKDGREIWISTLASKISHEGRLAWLVSFVDITEQKRQRERLMMTDRLVALGELAAGTAHELNNPLTSVIGFSQLLLDKNIPDDIREDVKLIHEQAQRAANVTKNLLTFARKHTPIKQRCQINKLIEDTLKLRAYELKANNIEVVKQLAPDLPEVMADAFQMQQVFFNIIINAEYFMIEAHKRGTLTITTKKLDNTVLISFADDGPGIPPENLRCIFDPFFTTKEPGKGTGLGLSICHGTVTEHGGQIYAESEPGRGATFFIELPITGI